MKKIIFFSIIYFFIFTLSYAKDCSIVCPSETIQIIEKESAVNKFTGINFLSKKIIEIAIEKELKSELESKFDAQLDIFTVKRLKNGEFEKLQLKSNLFLYRAMSVSSFIAETVCPYNKIVYKNKKVYFPYDLPFKFKAQITNSDIKNIINSYEFQREIEKSAIKINNFVTFRLLEPNVELKNGKLNFVVPVKTFLSKEASYIKIVSDIEVNNNEIVLKDTTFSSKSNIINISMFGTLINKINPVAFQNNTINSKYCKLYITSAKVINNVINIEGIFLINQNYGR